MADFKKKETLEEGLEKIEILQSLNSLSLEALKSAAWYAKTIEKEIKEAENEKG